MGILSNGYVQFLIVVTVYFLILYFLNKKGIMEKYSLSFYGPFLMWRTKRGKAFLDRMAKYRKFWEAYGLFCTVFCISAMIFMFILLLWQATLVPLIPPEAAPTPDMILGIPGLNPFIPLWYGILGLAFAMIIHEGAHGIMARASDIKVLSVGLLMFIVPVGAFVEPDEEDIVSTTSKRRSRMFAVGPGTNLIFALVFASIFSWGFMGALSIPSDAVIISGVQRGFPAENATILPWTTVIEVNGTVVSGPESFTLAMTQIRPGQNFTLRGMHSGKLKEYNITAATMDKYQYYARYYPDENSEEFRDVGYIGVSIGNPGGFLEVVQRPVRSADGAGELIGNLFFYAGAIPIGGYVPFPPAFRSMFEINGILSSIPENSFWILAGSMYWIMWISLMIGLTNALPAIPLDGGYVFRDGIKSFILKYLPDTGEEKAEKITAGITRFFGYSVLFLFLWMFFGPRLLGIFVW